MSLEKTTQINLAENILTAKRQNCVGEWRGAKTKFLIKLIDYRRKETTGDTTNTDTVSRSVNIFDGANFTVGVFGQNTHFVENVRQYIKMERLTINS